MSVDTEIEKHITLKNKLFKTALMKLRKSLFDTFYYK